jgi:hypothetical protein
MRRASGLLAALPLLACTSPAWAVSGLMVRCNIADAEVWLGDQRIGSCPGQFTLMPGNTQLVVRKDKDAETEWYWSDEVLLEDDKVIQVDAQLKEHRTQAGMQREMERLAQARREEEMRQQRREEEQRQAQARRSEEQRQAVAHWEEERRLTAPRRETLAAGITNALWNWRYSKTGSSPALPQGCSAFTNTALTRWPDEQNTVVIACPSAMVLVALTWRNEEKSLGVDSGWYEVVSPEPPAIVHAGGHGVSQNVMSHMTSVQRRGLENAMPRLKYGAGPLTQDTMRAVFLR